MVNEFFENIKSNLDEVLNVLENVNGWYVALFDKKCCLKACSLGWSKIWGDSKEDTHFLDLSNDPQTLVSLYRKAENSDNSEEIIEWKLCSVKTKLFIAENFMIILGRDINAEK